MLELGGGTKQIMGEGKLGVEDLWDPLEMVWMRMLLHAAYCQGRNKTGVGPKGMESEVRICS